MIACNGRLLDRRTTGIPRYVQEITARMAADLRIIRPRKMLTATRAHLWEQIMLPRLIQGDLLWSPGNTGPLSVANQIVTIHDVAVLDHPEWFGRRFSHWYGFVVRRLVHRVRHILTVSEHTKARLIAHTGVSDAKVTVTPLAAGDAFHPNAAKNYAGVLRHFGVTADRYVLSVGSIEPRKNGDRLLQAWRDLEDEVDDDIVLVVAGAPAEPHIHGRYGLENLSGRVIRTGFVDDDGLAALMANALVFAYPSLYEGFGLPPLEALASGTPCLTSNTSSLPEVVGDAAVIVDPLDTGQIADGLRQLIDDPALRQRLTSAGLDRAKRFSWDETAEKTKAVLGSV
ncbi:MAG: glycosyltransferase family 4 protein [Hyphomicrobiales bacterium]|nr:glycosyltransferase family 4 protein [Hyphomicrobiales bacterium]